VRRARDQATRDSDGKPSQGFRTSLSFKDEFRCLVAALYGQASSSLTAKDVALRCAYYGKGHITAKEMQAGFKRDEDAFTFAALFNRRVYYLRDLKQLMEGEFLAGRELWTLYNEHQASLKKRDKQIHDEITFAVPTQESDKESIAAFDKRLTNLTSQVSELKQYILWAGFGIFIILMILHR
jgi:hypothetical protein